MGKAAVEHCVRDDPKELFSVKGTATESYLSNKLIPISGAVVGFAGMAGFNRSRRRPLFAAVPLVVASTLVGLGLGIIWQLRSDRYLAERDAVYRHYIELHPEDFPAKERVLVGDMFKPWLPIR